jgi:hypothetical protein
MAILTFPTAVPAGGSTVLFVSGVTSMNATQMAAACASGRVTLAGAPLALYSAPAVGVYGLRIPAGLPVGDATLSIDDGVIHVDTVPVRVVDTSGGTRFYLRSLLTQSPIRGAPTTSHSAYLEGGGAFNGERPTGTKIGDCWLDFASAAFQDRFSGALASASLHGVIGYSASQTTNLETIAGGAPLLGVSQIPAMQWTVRWPYRLRRGGGTAFGSGNCDLVSFYVWRPSSQSVVGRIFDNSSSVSAERPSSTAPWGVVRTFAGQAVTGIEDGDVLVAEAISHATLSQLDADSELFYDGGADPPATDGATVGSDAAAVIEGALDIFGGVATGRPRLIYRTYRSDDLSRPMYGPIELELASIDMTREGAAFEAKAPSLNLARTGETFSLDRFKSLRGCL